MLKTTYCVFMLTCEDWWLSGSNIQLVTVLKKVLWRKLKWLVWHWRPVSVSPVNTDYFFTTLWPFLNLNNYVWAAWTWQDRKQSCELLLKHLTNDIVIYFIFLAECIVLEGSDKKVYIVIEIWELGVCAELWLVVRIIILAKCTSKMVPQLQMLNDKSFTFSKYFNTGQSCLAWEDTSNRKRFYCK